MRGEFDEEFEPVRRGRDTELTLGAGALLGIFFAMVLLCGLFFGLGFAVGRYGPNESAREAQQQPAPAAPAPGTVAVSNSNSKSKPSASSQTPAPPQEESASAPEAPTGETAPSEPKVVEQPAKVPILRAVPPAPVQIRPVAQPQVKPALPAQSHPTPQPRPPVPPAPLSTGIMVQIAAVSHQEDADVLVGALRRRGYSVSVRRMPADKLLHVQVGPFSNRNDANAMRLKLLNDGYNAMIQP